MRTRWLLLTALVAAMTLGSPAAAGGWASVRLDEPASAPVAGLAWQTGLIVKQHDVNPIDVDRLRIDATHRESGQTITTDAEGTRTIGHYSVELTFPEPGTWKWTVTPEPFPTVAMVTLSVAASPFGGGASSAAPAYRVTVAPGDCAKPTTGPVKFSTTVDAAIGRVRTGEPLKVLAELLNEATVPTVVTILDGEDGPALACGAVDPATLADVTSVALQPVGDGALAGAAVLTRTDDGWSMETVVVDTAAPARPIAPATDAADVSVRILGIGSAAVFDPPLLQIAAGTSVTWVNEGDLAHTITGSSVSFNDSGMIDPGASFSQTFGTPGTYNYLCDPHPGMVGTIVVE